MKLLKRNYAVVKTNFSVLYVMYLGFIKKCYMRMRCNNNLKNKGAILTLVIRRSRHGYEGSLYSNSV